MAKQTLKLLTAHGGAIFMEVEREENEKSIGSDLEGVSAASDFLEEGFEKVSKSIAGVAESLQSEIDRIGVRGPDKVEVELSGTLKGKANFWIVEGESSGALKLKLTWDKLTERSSSLPTTTESTKA